MHNCSKFINDQCMIDISNKRLKQTYNLVRHKTDTLLQLCFCTNFIAINSSFYRHFEILYKKANR